MKFSQPLVLLLGGVLSASGVGCSAISAIVTDSRPAHRENRSDTDRIAAIGRVFENQGRYDKAEVMYRRALKSRPQDSELRNQLQQLAERRKEHSFGPSGTANAIAVADIVSPPKASIRATENPSIRATENPSFNRPAVTATVTVPAERNIAPVVNHVPEVARQISPPPQIPSSSNSARIQPDISNATQPGISNAAHVTPVSPNIELTSGKNDGWRKTRERSVSSEDVLIALESPDEHIELLLDALSHGDSNETKALAATLLGDCDPANTEVRNALHEHQKSEQAPEVLLAICDSQIERWEADGQTLSQLFSLCSKGTSETQLQAASQLRNFAGTDFESSCLETLNQLLSSSDPNVRATAALTLGDFASLNADTVSRLQNIVKDDASSIVREAAESSLSRQQTSPLQAVPTLSPSDHY